MNLSSPIVARLSLATLAMAAASSVLAGSPSWVFQPSNYSHDPYSGARVAQYQRVDPVEDLSDPRAVTSRYTRRRTTLRGADGAIDATYEVQNYGNGRGGMDAEWERFHDAWMQSSLTGSYYYRTPAPYGGGYPGYGAPGHGRPGYGGPGYGGLGYGGPGYGRPVYPHTGFRQ